MASMRKIIIITMFVLNSVFISISASAQQRTFSEELTEVFGKVWPYEAFLAIPKIGEIAPRLIIPVDSVASMLIRLCTDNSARGLFNIGSGKPTSLRSFVENMIQKYSLHVDIKYKPSQSREFEPFSFWADMGCWDMIE